MGLYLCIFDNSGNELDGVEVGAYSDFNFFRDAVATTVEQGNVGSVCPVLNAHSDSDGEWSSQDAKHLLKELELVTEIMLQCPPVEFNSEWKKQVAKALNINIRSLLDCFFDIDGEPLVERLCLLAQLSISSRQPILFQ